MTQCIFLNLHENSCKEAWLVERTILTTRNARLKDINSAIYERTQGVPKDFLSSDTL